MVKAVLFHASCADGFCSAWVTNMRLVHPIVGEPKPEDVEFFAVSYGDPHPVKKHYSEIYVLDFSYKQPVLREISSMTDKLVVLDHHESAMKELKDLQLPNTTIQFDMDKSGAMLTWNYFYPKEKAPWIVSYVQDRDLWKFELFASRDINAALSSYQFDFRQWDIWAALDHPPQHLLNEGMGINRIQEKIVKDFVKHSVDKDGKEVLWDVAGHAVPVMNCTTFISETCGALAAGRPFAVTFFVRSDGKYVYSFRSDDNGANVSEIAKKFGGGGHAHAAGCESAEPLKFFRV